MENSLLLKPLTTQPGLTVLPINNFLGLSDTSELDSEALISANRTAVVEPILSRLNSLPK